MIRIGVKNPPQGYNSWYAVAYDYFAKSYYMEGPSKAFNEFWELDWPTGRYDIRFTLSPVMPGSYEITGILPILPGLVDLNENETYLLDAATGMVELYTPQGLQLQEMMLSLAAIAFLALMFRKI